MSLQDKEVAAEIHLRTEFTDFFPPQTKTQRESQEFSAESKYWDTLLISSVD